MTESQYRCDDHFDVTPLEDVIAPNETFGLVVDGTLATAKRFASDDYLDHRLRDRLFGTYAVEYATEQGLQQLVERAADRLLETERRERLERLDEFFAGLREGDMVAYGTAEVERVIEFGAVETALLASTLQRERRTELERAVTRRGGDVSVISSETERGTCLADTFGQVGGLLRFPVQ